MQFVLIFPNIGIMIKAILYDLDGVLVDATEWHYESLNLALEQVKGFKIKREEHIQIFNGLPTMKKLEILFDQGKVKKDDFDSIWKKKQDLTIEVIKKFKSPIIINHMKGKPQTMQSMPKYNNVILDIYDFFEKKISFLKDHNVKINNLILDPGIGFGKNLKHNLMLLSKISLFHSLGFPIMIGTSRKKFINQISGKYDTRERIGGTLSSVLYTLSQGVQIFRVHNVKEVKQGILIFKKLLLN